MIQIHPIFGKIPWQGKRSTTKKDQTNRIKKKNF